MSAGEAVRHGQSMMDEQKAAEARREADRREADRRKSDAVKF